MKLICTILYTALSFASGLADDIGPVSSNVLIGTLNPHTETLTPEDITATNNVIGLLEYIRRLMPVGINKFIPPTDPYKADSLPDAVFNNTSKMEGTVQLSNLVADGANDFVIEELAVRLNSSSVDYHIFVQEVVAEIDFEAHHFRYGPIVLDTSGHLKITLEGFSMKGVICFAPIVGVDPSYLQVLGLEVDSHVAVVKVNVDTSTVPPEVLKEIEDAVALSLANSAVEQLNSVFKKITLKQINQFLLG
ncbi:uncharacterized protein LOC115445144 [Manduca sexta]|uniref:uncharacterized protein LOC115445144 n=1 Tax=Manduca sexta TaxID=7130 RepID=UPI001182B808|nr:uncharacterized protein LOC115445144 [Manduca sexta]